jgi:hypothetical protein
MSEIKKQIEKLYDPFTIRLGGKVGAVLGAGLGYISGLAGGMVKHIILNELPYISTNLNEVFLRAFAYGSQVASELALAGLGIGALVAKFYTKKRGEFVYVEGE